MTIEYTKEQLISFYIDSLGYSEEQDKEFFEEHTTTELYHILSDSNKVFFHGYIA